MGQLLWRKVERERRKAHHSREGHDQVDAGEDDLGDVRVIDTGRLDCERRASELVSGRISDRKER
jgi:hypothetical protein